MFNLIAQQAKLTGATRRLALQATQGAQTMHQYPVQNFNSIFGGIFGKKKPETEKKAEEKKPEKKTEKAP